MSIRKKVLQVTALFAAAGAQAQNPAIQTINSRSSSNGIKGYRLPSDLKNLQFPLFK